MLTTLQSRLQLVFAISVAIAITSCFKGEGLPPYNPPTEIRIDASVPSILYSNKNEIALDAMRTQLINGQRDVLFLWSCPVYPVGHPPRIDKIQEPYTIVDNLTLGKYTFRLRVQDTKGHEAVGDYPFEVLNDTLSGAPKLGPLPDQFVELPITTANVSAASVYDVNPIGRDLSFEWSVVQQPSGSGPLKLGNKTSPLFSVSELELGDYIFGIKVTNEKGLSSTGNIKLKVLKDPLPGTSRVYEGLEWQKKVVMVDIGEYYHYVELEVYEPKVFEYRNSNKLEVMIWDQSKQDWSFPQGYNWYLRDNAIYIQNDLKTDSLSGKTARVMVKFL